MPGRFSFIPLTYANRDLAYDGEIIMDPATGDIFTKITNPSTNEISYVSATTIKVNEALRNRPNGFAGLDENTKIPEVLIPNILSSTQVNAANVITDSTRNFITSTQINNFTTAFTHVSNKTNPHAVTAAQVGAAPSSHVGSGAAAHALATTSVHGFMNSADKAKLDKINIGALATVDLTPAGILTALKTVDGSSSGLDADLIDGKTLNSLVQTDITNPLFKVNGPPIDALHITNKSYVDTEIAKVSQGLSTKESVVVATTANITLSGTKTIDGIAVVVGDRVLVKNQTTAANNGIYVVSSTTWTRATDAVPGSTLNPGAYVFVSRGNTQASSGWVLGQDGTTWSQFSGAGQLQAGSGILIDGNVISLTDTGVAAGTYSLVTVDTKGRITSATHANSLAQLGLTAGSGGGLDVDKLDGKHAADFATSTHTHAKATASIDGLMSKEHYIKVEELHQPTANEILSTLAANDDGTGKNLNAQTLQGKSLIDFVHNLGGIESIKYGVPGQANDKGISGTPGRLFVERNTDGSYIIYYDTGSAWEQVASKIVPWANISGKPSSFTPIPHKSTHAANGADVITPSDINAADRVHTHLWANITDRPNAMTPTSHNSSHRSNPSLGTIGTDPIQAIDIGAADREHTHTVTWDSVTLKPATFAPAPHKASHAIGQADALSFSDVGAAPSSHVGSGGSTQHVIVTDATAGFMSPTMFTKLSGIAEGAEVNQNAFSNIKVGTSTIAADTKMDIVEFVAGSNISVSADTINSKITISAINITPSSHIGTGGASHADATISVSGFMSPAMLTKLNGIATGAEVNQNAFSNIKVGESTIAADKKEDILEFIAGSNISLVSDVVNDSITINVTDVTPSSHIGTGGASHADVTTVSSGFMSPAMLTKLNGIANNAEVNQNAFSNIKVGTSTIAADKKEDILEFIAGSNISILADTANDKITINTIDVTPSSHIGSGGSSHADVTTGSSGFMSSAMLTKLNGIAEGAEVNQNAFSNITIGTTAINAASKTDVFKFEAGSNISLTADTLNKKAIINVIDVTPSSHIGSGGASHALAVAGGNAGFISGTEKTCISFLNTAGTVTGTNYLYCNGYFKATRVYGAIYNDYAEFRQSFKEFEPGTVVIESGKGYIEECNKRRNNIAEVVTDTYGFAIGEYKTENEYSVPVAISGRVLVKTDKPKETFRIGDAVCTGKCGTVSKMKWWEKLLFKESILGYVVEIPTYTKWRKKIDVNERIWIKLK
jgi:hypothetical protein